MYNVEDTCKRICTKSIGTGASIIIVKVDIYEWAQAESRPIQPFLTTRQHQKYKFLVIVSNTAHLMMNYSTLKYWPWDFHFPFLQTKLLARQEWWISH